MHYSTPTENSTTLTREVTISSAIADLSGPTAEYYAIRYFDSKQHKGKYAGSGWAECSLSELAEILDKKPATVRKNLYQGLHSGFFWNVTIKGDYVRIRYKAEARIAKDKGLISLGAIAMVELNQIKHIRILATDAHTEALQRKSIHYARQACEQQGDDGKKQWITPISKLFLTREQKQCQNWGAETNVIYQGKRCTFVTSEFTLFGASQEKIGKSMTRHKQTIRRRLDRSHRAKKGLAIAKTQLAYNTQDERLNWQEAAIEAEDERDYDKANECHRRYNFGHAVFSLSCNLYQFDLHLLRQRWKRKDLKKRWNGYQTPETPEKGRPAVPPKYTKLKRVTEGCDPVKPVVTQLNRHPLWRKVGNKIVAIGYSHLTCMERKLAAIPY